MDARRIWTISVVQLVAAALLLWWMFTNVKPWDAERTAGAVLVLAGLAGIVTARYQLGRSFAIKPEAHQLVTRGLYSRIRNPIYVFGVVLVTGLVLVSRRPILWLLVFVVIIGQTIRARREARVLEAAFGDAYREYRRKTWF